MKVALINNKGGVGKTTTAVNLAAALALSGKDVLIADLDAQASASYTFGLSRGSDLPTMADVLFDNLDPVKAVRRTSVSRLDLIPGHMELANTDLILADVPGRESRLKNAFETVSRAYDYVFFDCPPSLSIMTINAITACDTFLIPLCPEYLAYEGLVDLMFTVKRVREEIGSSASLVGILFTMLQSENRMTAEYKAARTVMNRVREQYGIKVFKTVIRRDVGLSEAPGRGQTIFQYNPRSRGAKAYNTLAIEVEKRIR